MLLLLLLSPLVAMATSSSWGPKHKRCPTLLAATTQFDLDNSGGLDRSEFSNFLGSIASGSSNVPVTLFNDKEEAAYNWLLCQCYYVFGLPLTCCDNTTTTEKSSSTWKEVSLDELATDDDSIKLGRKSYSKVFCEEIMWLMDETGMILATNLTNIDVSATTTTTTSTAATTQSLVENINTTEPIILSPDDAVIAAVGTTTSSTTPTTETAGVKDTSGLIVSSSSSSSSSESNVVVSLTPSSIDSKSIQASGFAVGDIIALVLAMTLIAFIIVALIVVNRRRRSSNNKRRRVLKDDSNLSKDIENNDTMIVKDDVDIYNWHDNDDNDDVGQQGVGTSSRSSLAAMGVASLVTTQWSVSGGGGVDMNNIDDDGSYIGSIVEEVDNCIDKPMGV